MPSKQAMLDLGSTSAIIEYANSNLGVRKKIKNFEQLNGVSVKITFCMSSDESELFQGVGSSKLEATAIAVSTKFPA